MDNDALGDLFSGLGSIQIKRLFGGKGIYHQGLIVAIVMRGDLLLKADEKLASELRDEGCTQWTYTHAKSGKHVAMPYWTVPDCAADDPDEMAVWAKKAFEASLRTKK